MSVVRCEFFNDAGSLKLVRPRIITVDTSIVWEQGQEEPKDIMFQTGSNNYIQLVSGTAHQGQAFHIEMK